MLFDLSRPKPLSEDHAASNYSYFQEYCRVHMAHVVLNNQMKALIADRMDLLSKATKLEVITVSLFHFLIFQFFLVQQRRAEQLIEAGSNEQSKKKRTRRTAPQIERRYRCPVETCEKSYGSEGSLNQHVKNKHPEIHVSQEGKDDQQYRSSQVNHAEFNNHRHHHHHRSQGLSSHSQSLPDENSFTESEASYSSDGYIRRT